MNTLIRLLPAMGIACAAAPALAASGQIDSFGASATHITAGGSVDFSVSFGVTTNQSEDGFNDPAEPSPLEGHQTWTINWYQYENESVSEISLSAGGQGYTEFPNVGGGTSHTGGWSFSILFPTAGTFDIAVSGGWTGQGTYYTSGEIATRDCYNNDPGGSNDLVCSSWSYQYPEVNDVYSASGSFDSRTLTIEVSAVPEPATVALWLAGLGVVLGARRRRAPR